MKIVTTTKEQKVYDTYKWSKTPKFVETATPAFGKINGEQIPFYINRVRQSDSVTFKFAGFWWVIKDGELFGEVLNRISGNIYAETTAKGLSFTFDMAQIEGVKTPSIKVAGPDWINSYTQDYIDKTRTEYKETNDCTVIALSIACDIPYEQAHKALKDVGRKNRKGVPWKLVVNQLQPELRQRLTLFTRKDHGCKTVGQFVKKYKTGTYYVTVSGHALAIRDGAVYDWKKGDRRILKGVWQVS